MGNAFSVTEYASSDFHDANEDHLDLEEGSKSFGEVDEYADTIFGDAMEGSGTSALENTVQRLQIAVYILSVTVICMFLYWFAVPVNYRGEFELVIGIPIFSALFTFFHIWLALRMIFYPVNFWGYEITDGIGIGWQGVIPRKSKKMATIAFAQAEQYVLKIDEIVDRVNPEMFLTALEDDLDEILMRKIKENLTQKKKTKKPVFRRRPKPIQRVSFDNLDKNYESDGYVSAAEDEVPAGLRKSPYPSTSNMRNLQYVEAEQQSSQSWIQSLICLPDLWTRKVQVLRRPRSPSGREGRLSPKNSSAPRGLSPKTSGTEKIMNASIQMSTQDLATPLLGNNKLKNSDPKLSNKVGRFITNGSNATMTTISNNSWDNVNGINIPNNMPGLSPIPSPGPLDADAKLAEVIYDEIVHERARSVQETAVDAVDNRSLSSGGGADSHTEVDEADFTQSNTINIHQSEETHNVNPELIAHRTTTEPVTTASPSKSILKKMEISHHNKNKPPTEVDENSPTNKIVDTTDFSTDFDRMKFLQSFIPEKFFNYLRDLAKREVKSNANEFVEEVKEILLGELDIGSFIVGAFVKNKELLNDFFLNMGREEFDLIQRAGFWIGLFMGVVQLIFYTIFSNQPLFVWIFLPLSGLVIGLGTNALAISVCFNPIIPLEVKGPFGCTARLQGLFLKRQPTVCAVYSKLLKMHFVNLPEILGYLTSPANEKVWLRLLDAYDRFVEKCFTALYNPESKYAKLCFKIMGIDEQKMEEAKIDFIQGLRDEWSENEALLQKFLEYFEQATDIERTNTKRMRGMSPKEFERLLHPVFEEDEWILIVLGGILGLAVGFVQCIVLGA